MKSTRALHWVFKISDRSNTISFLEGTLDMIVLRHEEFREGCEAACNGPYDGRWSKTMMGYGNEDDHFVLELTYNYGIKSYERGNDFHSIVIANPSAYLKAMNHPTAHNRCEGSVDVTSPDGYVFRVLDVQGDRKDPMRSIVLNVTNIDASMAYWQGLIGMEVIERGNRWIDLSYDEEQCTLRLMELEPNEVLMHKEAYGRIAFSCPTDTLPGLQNHLKASKQKVLKELVSLDTPGKATVHVIIVADPDDYEICFVGDESFRELSKMDPVARELLQEAMDEDTSKEWFAKRDRGT